MLETIMCLLVLIGVVLGFVFGDKVRTITTICIFGVMSITGILYAGGPKGIIFWFTVFSAQALLAGLWGTAILQYLFSVPENTLPPYFTKKDAKELEKATTFEEIGAIALRVLSRMPSSVGMISGPISNGGLGSIEKNMRILIMWIAKLRQENKVIFEQTPFEPAMWRVKKILLDARFISPEYREEVELQLLNGVYLRLLESGRISILYFIEDWWTSFGARWEREQGTRLGITIEDLVED